MSTVGRPDHPLAPIMRTYYVVAFSGLGAVMVVIGLVRGHGMALVVGSMFVAVGLSLWRLSSRHGR